MKLRLLWFKTINLPYLLESRFLGLHRYGREFPFGHVHEFRPRLSCPSRRGPFGVKIYFWLTGG
jgi:hypothetical protein